MSSSCCSPLSAKRVSATTMSVSERLPPDFLKTFVRHIRMLRFIGLDIFHERHKSFPGKYARLCIFSVLYVPMAVGQVLYIALGGRAGARFVDVANAVPTTFMALQDGIKMVMIIYKRNEIAYVIRGIAEIWPTPILSDRKKKTLNKWLRHLKILDNTIFICAIVSLSIYEITPLCITLRGVLGAREGVQYLYPLQLYFAHWLTSFWQYAIGYLYLLATSVTTHMILYIPVDLLLVSLTFNLSALLDLLQIDLEDAVRNYDPDVAGSVQDVKDIVARHQTLLRLADKLSEIFGVVMFSLISFSSIVICCFGFLTAVADSLLLNNLLAALAVVAAVWSQCWPGQLLVDTSLGLAAAAYRSEWCDKDPALQKYIVIIMTRAQKPCYLSALGFSNLTLANFSKILSTSWSYLSLLNQMYQDTHQ